MNGFQHTHQSLWRLQGWPGSRPRAHTPQQGKVSLDAASLCLGGIWHPGSGWRRPVSLISPSCPGSDCNLLFLALVPLLGGLSQHPQPPASGRWGFSSPGDGPHCPALPTLSSGGPGWRPGAGRLPPASRAWPLRKPAFSGLSVGACRGNSLLEKGF